MMQFFPNEIASWLKNVHVVQKCYVQASYFCVLKSDKIMSAFFVIFGKKNAIFFSKNFKWWVTKTKDDSTPKHNLYFFVYYNPPDKTLYS